MSKKPRKAKHNPTKRYIRTARACLRGLVVAWTDDSKNCLLVERKTGQVAKVTQVISNAISQVPHRWSIIIAAIGTDANGQQYMKSEAINTNQPYFQSELTDYLNERHQDMLSAMNSKQLSGVAWIAAPYEYDWSEEEAFKLVEMINERYSNAE